MTDVGKLINEIGELKHFKTIECPNCGEKIRYHCLEIQITCPKCRTYRKVRASGGIGTEIYDLIDAVLIWAGTGEDFEAVLKRHSIIQKEIDEDKETEHNEK